MRLGNDNLDPPFQLVSEWTDGEGRLDATLERRVKAVLVFFKQEVPALLCASSNRKHCHAHIIREAAGLRGAH